MRPRLRRSLVLAPLFDERPFHILTVTEVTRDIKDLLEDTFASVWVEGEISNWRVVQSGHAYFTLKDVHSQLRTVMFRSALRQLPFEPEAGMQVVAHGHLTVYEPRGDYQLLAEVLEPKGVGALQVAFEQLKERLFQEGLFDETRKRPLPLVPQRIGIVTSPTGAAIRDIIHVVHRRRANVHLYLYPAHVQGKEAVPDIVRGIAALNAWRPQLDVLIVGRGGGSLEDLWAFNEEKVARAIAASELPVISAVGHEIDYTIADFVADVRAATPSNAAEIAVRDHREVGHRVEILLAKLKSAILRGLAARRQRLQAMIEQYGFRRQRDALGFLQQRIDDLAGRLRTAL